MIRAIIFDIGGVLLDDPSVEMVSYYANALQVSREEVLKALSKVWDAWHTGSISEQEVWGRVSADLQITSFSGDSLWLDGFKHAYKERPEMFALIKRLKQQGYTIALLSNTELPIMNYLKQKPYDNVDVCLYSCEVGISKPEKAIYELMLSRLGVQPQEAVFIDDRVENVNGAMSIGISGIVFRDVDDLEQQFHRLDIKV